MHGAAGARFGFVVGSHFQIGKNFANAFSLADGAMLSVENPTVGGEFAAPEVFRATTGQIFR